MHSHALYDFIDFKNFKKSKKTSLKVTECKPLYNFFNYRKFEKSNYSKVDLFFLKNASPDTIYSFYIISRQEDETRKEMSYKDDNKYIDINNLLNDI